MEQLESRALGKPKETVATEQAEPDELAAMRQMSTEARRILESIPQDLLSFGIAFGGFRTFGLV